MEASVLVVEDESIVALDIKTRLSSLGLTVSALVRDGRSAIQEAGEKRPDLILMDIEIAGDIDGIETAAYIAETYDIPSVFLTAFSDRKSLERAKKAGGYGYLLKPFQERELMIAVEIALFKHGAERELRINRKILDTTVNAIDEGVITTGSDGTVILLNRAAQSLTGWTGDSALGKPIGHVLREEPIDATGGDGEVPLGNAMVMRRDGTRFPARVARIPIEGTEDLRGNTVLVVRDVTSVLEYERTLIEARKAAESADRMKSEFMARMSHEFRTPLNTIMGMTRLVLNTLEERDHRAHLQISLTSAQEMMSLVTDLLDYASREPGKAPSLRKVFSLSDLLDSLAARHGLQCARRGIRFALVDGPTVPARIVADEACVRRILDHLLANAIKFTSAGSIVLVVTFSEGFLEFAVEDTGAGIPVDKMDEVFAEFTQLADSRTRTAGGTGMGLSFARRMAREMGGDITLTSVPGRGTTATCRIPVRTDDSPPSEEEDDLRQRWFSFDRPLAAADPVTRRVLEPWIAARGMPFPVPGEDTLPPDTCIIPELETVTFRFILARIACCPGAEQLRTSDAVHPAGDSPLTPLHRLRDMLHNEGLREALDYVRVCRDGDLDPEYEETVFRLSLALRKGDVEGAFRLLDQALRSDGRRQQEE